MNQRFEVTLEEFMWRNLAESLRHAPSRDVWFSLPKWAQSWLREETGKMDEKLKARLDAYPKTDRQRWTPYVAKDGSVTHWGPILEAIEFNKS